MTIVRKYGKVEKLKMDKENTPNKRQMFYIKYEQREEKNRAQIELKKEERSNNKRRTKSKHDKSNRRTTHV